jgi:8-oxo-dGTP pyrophosphatase MutT (NUDIX family)
VSELDNINVKNPATAHASSSIILLRPSKTGFQVLMERRCQTLKFAPGAYVFPGGRVDDVDHENAKTYAGSFDDGAYRIAALRELAEETGVNLSASYAQELVYFAHWITPPQSPKRFETKFYLGQTTQDHILEKDDVETDEVCWVCPNEMLKQEEEGSVNMMFPTRLNLMKLIQSSTIEGALSKAKLEKVSTVMPEHEMRDGEMWFTIPKDAGYPLWEVKRENIFELMGVKKNS